MRMEHFQEGNGFTYFVINKHEIKLQFVNTRLEVVYESYRQ